MVDPGTIKNYGGWALALILTLGSFGERYIAYRETNESIYNSNQPHIIGALLKRITELETRQQDMIYQHVSVGDKQSSIIAEVSRFKIRVIELTQSLEKLENECAKALRAKK